MAKLFIVSSIVFSFVFTSLFADEYVKGYFKKDGTYVTGHYRTEANSTRNDNYSTKGNTNIHTGEKGYKDNDDYNYKSSSSTGSSTWVNGYYRKDGTYVNGHYRKK